MEPLKVKEKIAYGAGDFSCSMLWNTLMLFLANFYTDTYGLSPALTGIFYAVVLILSAFIDVGTGMMADRTQSRWGRYRPYLLYMAIPFGLCAAMLFYTPPFPEGFKRLYALVSFLLMMTAYSFVNVPYSSLSSALSADPVERTGLMGYRFAGAYSGGLLVQIMMLPLVKLLGGEDRQAGYFYTMILLGMVTATGILIAFRYTRERTLPLHTQSMKEDLKDLLHNKPWLLLFTISFIFLFSLTFRNIILKYYFDYYVSFKNITLPLIHLQWPALPAFYATGTLSILVSVMLTPAMAKKTGKKKLFLGASLLTVFSLSAFYFLKPSQLQWMFFLQAVYSFFSGPIIPLLWSMYTDAIDYAEWRHGRRATGLLISASLFANKNGFALGSLVTLMLLSMAGYQPNSVQTPGTIHALKLIVSLLPAGGTLAIFFLMHFYQLNESVMNRIKKSLCDRRKSG